MHFDWTITFGSVIQLVILLGTLIKLVSGSLKKITVGMERMQDRVDLMWAWILMRMSKDERDNYEAWIRNYTHVDSDLMRRRGDQ